MSRTESKLRDLRTELRGVGADAEYLVCDLAEPDQAAGAAAEILRRVDGVDIVLHNATVGQEGGSTLDNAHAAQWTHMFDVVVWSGLELCRGLRPSMAARGGGSIVTVVSSTGVTPTPGYAVYGLAKGTLLLLAKYMAKEWGSDGIRANCLNPGSIARPGEEQRMQEMAQRVGVADRISLGRVGRQDEVLMTALFLASDASSFISGQVLNIDGGRF